MTDVGVAEPRRGIRGPVLGMVLFITSEVMFFGGLFSAYLSTRARYPEWPPHGVEIDRLIPSVLTVVLVASSVTAHRAVTAARADERRPAATALLATIALGVLFLGGQALEYARLGFSLDDSAFTTVFFTLTGFHGLHVAAGIVILALALARVRSGSTPARTEAQVEAGSYYWHFVDAIWLVLFTIVYLIQ